MSLINIILFFKFIRIIIYFSLISLNSLKQIRLRNRFLFFPWQFSSLKLLIIFWPLYYCWWCWYIIILLIISCYLINIFHLFLYFFFLSSNFRLFFNNINNLIRTYFFNPIRWIKCLMSFYYTCLKLPIKELHLNCIFL